MKNTRNISIDLIFIIFMTWSEEQTEEETR